MGYLLAILLFLHSCAKKDAEVLIDTPSSDLIIQESGLSKVYGTLTVGGVAKSDLSVWVLDLTSGKKISTLTNAEGDWSIPTSKFTVGHDYAFHLFDSDALRLAVIDFSAEAGLQGAVSYSGGYGMDFGTINLPMDAFGLIDLASLVSSPPRVSLAGGFALNKDKTGAIEEMALPDYVDTEKSGFGHSLICDMPNEILNSFYLRSLKPHSYQLALNKFSGFFVKLVPNSSESLKHLWAAIPVNWMMQARRKLTTFASYFSAIPWEASKRIVLAKSGTIEADFSLPKLPCLGCAMDYYLGRDSSQADELLTQGISTRVFMIPKITAVSQETVNFPIDYTNAALENGLTKPFTLTDSNHDLRIVISRPLMESMAPSLNQRSIMVKFIYSSSGLEKTPNSSDFSSPYDASHQTSEGGWELSSQILTRKLVDGVSQDTLTIPKELLLSARTDIDTISLQIVYESAHSRSGTMVSFAR